MLTRVLVLALAGLSLQAGTPVRAESSERPPSCVATLDPDALIAEALGPGAGRIESVSGVGPPELFGAPPNPDPATVADRFHFAIEVRVEPGAAESEAWRGRLCDAIERSLRKSCSEVERINRVVACHFATTGDGLRGTVDVLPDPPAEPGHRVILVASQW